MLYFELYKKGKIKYESIRSRIFLFSIAQNIKHFPSKLCTSIDFWNTKLIFLSISKTKSTGVQMHQIFSHINVVIFSYKISQTFKDFALG
jgi:hypothetical protein